MNVLDQRTLGVIIILLLSALVIIKHLATGSVLGDKPTGRSLRMWCTHIFNLFFLLIVNPTAAIMLTSRHFDIFDPTRIAIGVPWLLRGLEIGGLVFYGLGYFLMGWALAKLGRNYQAGGNRPRQADQMVVAGPYKFVRHPMYVAALCISLGLACLTQSLALLSVFCTYVVLITFLVPAEEGVLRQEYGAQYIDYQHRVKRLAPFLY